MNRESSKELRELLDEGTRHVDGLILIQEELLGVSERFVVNLVTAALDKDTRKVWESSVDHKAIPKYNETIEFLKKRCTILERCEAVKPIAVSKPLPSKNSANQVKLSSTKAYAVTSKAEPDCDLCEGVHPNFKCEKFRSLTVPQRQIKVKELKLCFNCLRKGHQNSSCPSDRTCLKCEGKHHTLIHSEKSKLQSQPMSSVPKPDPVSEYKKPDSGNSVYSTCSVNRVPVSRLNNGLLMTAVVNVFNADGKYQPCRTFLDCGSQTNLVSSSMINSLRLPRVATKVEIVGANGQHSTLSEATKLEIRSRCSDYHDELECLVTNKITGLMPSCSFDVQSWNIPSGIALADPLFHSPKEVDLLIGIKHFFKLMMPGQLKLSDELPILQETRLGWVAAGAVEPVKSLQHCYSMPLQTLSEAMERFWTLEAVESSESLTSEERDCEEIYRSTTRRDAEGRYIVQLPLKESVQLLNNNRSLALRRFFLLEQRLQKNPDMRKLYIDFIQEYKFLHHCWTINEFDDLPSRPSYYMPHHAVIKPASSTTTLRVVFDGSASSTGPPLNNVLMVGPVVQQDLFSIALRFRKHRYAFTADISKMYRRILVDSSQTPLQRIFWRAKPCDPLEVIELVTVTYGTTSAPFLATGALIQLADDESMDFPVASKIVKEDFYVDDVLTGANSLEEAIRYRVELTQLLNRGGFPIHKWCANDEAIIQSIPSKEREKLFAIEDANVNQAIKTLGLLWDPFEDVFLFHANTHSPPKPPTKRNALSEIARLFDPLGLLSPVVVIAKCIMQQIWQCSLGWDDVLEGELLHNCLVFRDSLKDISSIKVPRYVALTDAQFELHGFADASNKAYGACIYIRAVSTASIKVSLVCSKSKVAPIKGLTIPRMELCAALLLSRLAMKVITAMQMEFHCIMFWSDSQIVLAWLQKTPGQLNLFVRNRAIEITNNTKNAKWNYVQSEENPADVVSRGQFPKPLAENNLWWNGPPFLQTREYLSEEPDIIPDDELPEWKPTISSSPVVVPPDLPFMTSFSSFRKLQRVVGYILRFASNARIHKSQRVTSEFLTVFELRRSMEVIVTYVQRKDFAEEIIRIQNGEPCRRLEALSPFYKQGLLRVGGRLENSRLSYDAKHQVLLPNNNPIVKSLIRALHVENLHIGPSGLISIIRRRFWLLNARSAVRKVIHFCLSCFRTNPRLPQPSMGDLPRDQVMPTAPFSKSGVDFAGPVFVRQGGRKIIPVKAYICIFVCFATKAIHLELVSDLSSAAFIAALHRFVARRGLVEVLHSDNGSNFAGAKTDLHDIYLLFQDDQAKGKLNEFCQTREIVWNFIPPRAPTFGGLWEAGVKSAKTHLKRVLQNAVLTFEEYATVLTQIEAILNSRPLFSPSADPNELEAITPGHFLIGRALTAIPEPTLEDVRINRLTRWQHLQQLRDHFWRRWSQEYLNTLQARQNWTSKSTNITPGIVVLLKEDNLPPLSWKLGRIERVYPGADYIVRVVDVKTATGIYRRPVSKLAPIPLEVSHQAPDSSSAGGCSHSSERTTSSQNAKDLSRTHYSATQ